MTYLLRTHRCWMALIACTCLGLLSGLVGKVDLPIPLPGLSSSPATLPLPAVLAVSVVAISFWCVERGEKEWMTVSARPLRLYSWGIFSLVVSSGFLVSLSLSFFLHDTSPALLLGRNILFFGALTLLIWQFGYATAAASSSILWVAFCCLFARNSSGEIYWWAWCIDRGYSNHYAWLFSFLCIVLLFFRYLYRR